MSLEFSELARFFPTMPSQRQVALAVRQARVRRAGQRGLGFQYTPGEGYEAQYQQQEERPTWASSLPMQYFAAPAGGKPGLKYAFPNPTDAYLNRSMQLAPGQGTYAGDMKAGVPTAVHPLLAAMYPQLQYQFAQAWNNPWTAQQFWGGTPQGIPIWGGSYTAGFQPAGYGVSTTPARLATPNNEAGTAVERF